MDDVWDFLHTVKQARKQTEDIDKILETGGLCVKECISNKTPNQEDSIEETVIKCLKEIAKESTWIRMEAKRSIDLSWVELQEFTT